MARRTQINILVALVSIAVLAAPAYAIINNKKQGEAKAEATFRSAAPAAAGFIDQFLKLRENSQRQLAAQYLGGPLVDIPNFDELANVFGFTSGSITDPQGNIVITYPVGVSIPGTSVHQLPAARAAAMAGGFVVSNLTTHPSAGGTSIPSIEISSSYTTWNNSIRVLTGAYSIAETPIGDFLSHLDSGGLVFLIDGQGQVISASPDKIPTASVVALSSLHRSLASAITRGAGGFYDTSNGNSNYFVAHDISGTSWKLVMVESRDLLFQGTGTSKGSFIQWLAFAGFV
ncbi:MAG TPA: cache domain-containing protein, partial [Acidimicrobiales bacterium]|nr:cache domain-containing protein [Acidimicrobiales bacterium]